MTCIVGLVDGDKVWIGGDSAGTAGWSQTIRADEKVFTTGPFLMGFTSSFRMGQLLRYSLTVPVQQSTQDDHAFMCTTFVDAVRACLTKGGFARKSDEVETGGTFLVGYRGRLYEVASDYQVAESVDGYHAVGCGDELALGSLFATPSMPARKRVTTALRAAERFSAGVSGPFVVRSAA